ncbi:helix-turn-helix domain-containing protein [Bifidobacterium adolescentis]|uniref:helix-turn-helix domain-containing protein n=1 Tax=Bifidobacterium adolescentis TaxID=1680 RepID=UPI00117767FC
MSYKNDNEKIIASRINGLLADTHTSQVQYAAILSMSQPTISAKLSGATRFTAKDIWRTALAFNVSTDYLYGLTDARTRGTCEREKAMAPV